jgi:signal transduction histidine kinase
MNPSFERRLIFVAGVAISAALVVLVAAGAMIALAVHVRGLQTQLGDTLDDIRAYVAIHGTPRDARDLADAVAVRFFRPDVDVVALDRTTRAEVRSRAQATSRIRLSNVAVEVSDRVARPPERRPSGLTARLALALAAFFGLGAVHDQFGTLTVIVKADEGVFAGTVGRFVPAFLFAVLLALAFGVVLARVLAHQALRPLVDVTGALERFAAGDLSPQPIPADDAHEFGALAVAYNGAIDQMSRAFAERERANAAMQQFIADAGHQLRTPLTVIRGFIAVLRKGELRSPEDRERILGTMYRQSLIMGSLIEKLILLERWEHGEAAGPREPIDVAQLVEDVVTPIVAAQPERAVRLFVESGASAAIDPSDLAYAVTNLVDNALKYTSGAVDVCVRNGSRVVVDVADEGPGMDAQEVRHAFDRFYRGARRNVDGSGLGLAIAKVAVERAGGTIAVETDVARGSRFTIVLPSVPATKTSSTPEG